MSNRTPTKTPQTLRHKDTKAQSLCPTERQPKHQNTAKL
jgi:hypothetical protein